jgi:flagellin-like hook-associated protein FlgL
LQIRSDFTSELVNTLETGAGQLVNADLNEESANMLALQTRQQLGTSALSIASQSEQAVLRLF